MSHEGVYDVYGFRPLTIDDVKAAFPDGMVAPTMFGDVHVWYKDWTFELFEAFDVVDPHFKRWVAEQHKSPAYTHAYRAYVEGYGDNDLDDCFATLAKHMDGTHAQLDHDNGVGYIGYIDGDWAEYEIPEEAEPQTGPALTMNWYGRYTTCGHPLLKWLEVCEEHFPELVPDRFGDAKRPMTDQVMAWLKSADSYASNPPLWNSALLGEIEFEWPYFRGGCRMDSLYQIRCRVLLESVAEPEQMEKLRTFFETMARELRVEVASCEMVDGYAAKDGVAEWTIEAEKEQQLDLSREYTLLGLIPAPVWWLWLAPEYSRLVGPWLDVAAPSTWTIDEDTNRTFIHTSSAPTRSEDLGDVWFASKFLARKNWLGDVRRRAEILPSWVVK